MMAEVDAQDECLRVQRVWQEYSVAAQKLLGGSVGVFQRLQFEGPLLWVGRCGFYLCYWHGPLFLCHATTPIVLPSASTGMGFAASGNGSGQRLLWPRCC